MKPAVAQGDLALTARPATREALRPFGRLVLEGSRLGMGRSGGVQVALEPTEPGPRRVAHLTAWPEARRIVLAPPGVALWWVALDDAKVPHAFCIPPGAGVAIEAGVWHAGPFPLEAATLTEIVETHSAADRVDRTAVETRLGVAAIRVHLPEDEGPRQAWRLDAAGGLMVEAALQGQIRLGALAYEDVVVAASGTAARTALESTVRGLQALWGSVEDVQSIPAVRSARDLFRGLDMDPAQMRPPVEHLLRNALAGRMPPPEHALADALLLVRLRLGLDVLAFDADRVEPPVVLRRGHAGEEVRTARGARTRVAGRPVLVDRQWPFGSLQGCEARTAVTSRTRRMVLVVPLAPGLDPAGTTASLAGVAAAVGEAIDATEVGRRVFG